MDNTTYEFFIRRCWNCDRFKHGANTDTWERLTIDYWEFKNPKPGANVARLETAYIKKLNEVQGFLDKAFNKLISVALKKKLPQSVIDDFSDRRALVADSDEPQVIFDCLSSTFPILNQYEIHFK